MMKVQDQSISKAFAKAIRKRIGSKKTQVCSLALTLLDACFKVTLAILAGLDLCPFRTWGLIFKRLVRTRT